MRDRQSLTPLKEIISQLGQCLLPFDLEDGKIWKLWKELVGEEISKNAYPVWIRNKILMVYVSGPIWAQELRYKERKIRNRLNKILGRDAVKEIRFKVG